MYITNKVYNNIENMKFHSFFNFLTTISSPQAKIGFIIIKAYPIFTYSVESR